MQHVGVGQHVLGVVAGPLPLLARAVAVVGGDPEVEPERLQAGQLVLRQRLGRAEVEGGGPPLPARTAGGADGRQRGQLVAQRLARRGAGRHHDVAARRGPPRRPRPGAATGCARREPRTPPGRRRAPRSATLPRPPPAPAAPRGGSAGPRGRAPPSSRSTTSRIETRETVSVGTRRSSQAARTSVAGRARGLSRRPSRGLPTISTNDATAWFDWSAGPPRRARRATGAQTRAVEKTWT